MVLICSLEGHVSHCKKIVQAVCGAEISPVTLHILGTEQVIIFIQAASGI